MIKKRERAEYQTVIYLVPPEEDVAGYFIAYLPDFGFCVCSAPGETQQEALAALDEVYEGVIRHYAEIGKTLPQPGVPPFTGTSGKNQYRPCHFCDRPCDGKFCAHCDRDQAAQKGIPTIKDIRRVVREEAAARSTPAPSLYPPAAVAAAREIRRLHDAANADDFDGDPLLTTYVIAEHAITVADHILATVSTPDTATSGTTETP